MKKAILGVWFCLSVSMVWASCVTNTYTMNGRMVTCTTCCYGSNCTTNCF